MYATRSDEHRWSFHSNRGYKRRLDYIMADLYVKTATTNCRVYPMQSQIFDSDHRIVVMDAAFPTKKQTKRISRKSPSTFPDISKLRDDANIQCRYSTKLESLLEVEDPPKEINDLERKIVEAIQEASKEVIPHQTRKQTEKPWTNQEYLKLLQQIRVEKDPLRRRSLYYEIRKKRMQLKNAYFNTKANELNAASEQRNTEREFRLMKNYISVPRLNRPLVPNYKTQGTLCDSF